MQMQVIDSFWARGQGNSVPMGFGYQPGAQRQQVQVRCGCGEGRCINDKPARFYGTVLVMPVEEQRAMAERRCVPRLMMPSLGFKVLTVFCLGFVAMSAQAARGSAPLAQSEPVLLVQSGEGSAASVSEDETFSVDTVMPSSKAVAQLNVGLDLGDDPLHPGCVCIYSLPDCQGQVSGRVVDECYPPDGVTLQENTMRGSCSYGVQKRYNCEEVLGNGARCELQTVDCCGVTTRSAACVLP